LFSRGHYIEPLAAPETIKTIPEKTLLAFAEHGEVNGVLPADCGDAEKMLARFAKVAVDNAALAAQLQRQGAQSFDKSWNELMDSIASKSNAVGKTTQTGGKR
jgi:transaldolase